jgi:hypothetical protein
VWLRVTNVESREDNISRQGERLSADDLTADPVVSHMTLLAQSTTASLLAGLHELRDAGLLTEEEFQNETQMVVAASDRTFDGNR